MAKFYEIPADYVSHLPEVLQDMEDIQLMAKIINPYLDALNGKIRRIVDNKTVTFADAEGISRWEQILGVSPPIGSTLEERRNACLAKLRARGVINLDTLRRVVETYLGVVGCTGADVATGAGAVQKLAQRIQAQMGRFLPAGRAVCNLYLLSGDNQNP